MALGRGDRLGERVLRAAEKEQEEDLPITGLIARMGGTGAAKVYRLVDGEERYARSIPVSEIEADTFEETLTRLCGGGDFVIKFYALGKNRGSINFSVDSDFFPPKKTPPEIKREGGLLPQTLGELQQVIAQAVAQAVGQAQRPAVDNTRENMLLKELFSMQERAAERSERHATEMVSLMKAQAIGAAVPAAAPGQLQQLKELAASVGAIREITGQLGGGDADGKHEPRSLATKLLEGPIERGVERAADRIIDKLWPTADGKKPEEPKTSTGAKAPQQPPAGTQVKPPANSRQMTPEELEKLKRGQQPAPVAPKASEALPPEKQ